MKEIGRELALKSVILLINTSLNYNLQFDNNFEEALTGLSEFQIVKD